MGKSTQIHCYPHAFLEECKYIIKEKKTSKFITDNIEISSDDSDKKMFC